ncbi:MAG: TonB-dependent receptor [Pseudomonadota bacterium]
MRRTEKVIAGFGISPVLNSGAGGAALKASTAFSPHIREGFCLGPAIVAGCLMASATITPGRAACAEGFSNSVVEQRYKLQVREKTLGEAVLSLAEQTERELLFPYVLADVEGDFSVDGILSASEALCVLLSGSRFSGALTERGVITISRIETGHENQEGKVAQSKRQKGLLGLLSSVSAIVLGGVTNASAQVDDATATDDEIVVTGKFFNQRFSDRLGLSPEEIPFSLDVLDRDALNARGFVKPTQYLQTLPNVTIGFSDPSAFAIEDIQVRGFNATQIVNGRAENIFSNPVDDVFIDSIELLRGPASVSVGPILPGGSINTVLTQPVAGEDFVNFEATSGQFDFHRLEADANFGALFGNENIRARVGIAHQYAGTPQEPAFKRSFAIRPVIEADLGPNTRIQGSISYIRGNGSSNFRFPLTFEGEAPPNVTPETYVGQPDLDFTFETSKGTEVFLEHSFLDDLKLTLRGQIQEVDFASRYAAPAYKYLDAGADYYYNGYAYGTDPNNPTADFYQENGKEHQLFYFGDAQLTGPINLFDQQHSFVLGATYQSLEFDARFAIGDDFSGTVDFNDIAGTTFVNTIPNDLTTGPGFEISFFESSVRTLASVYGELAIRPTSWLTIPVGVRYDEVTTDRTADPLEARIEQSDDAVTIRAGATAELSENVRSYFSYAQSFIPQLDIQDINGDPIGPETGNSYEVGFRTNFFDGLLNANLALFNTSRNDVAQLVDRDGISVQFFDTVGEVRHRGGEFDFTINNYRGLTLTGSYGFLEAEQTEGDGPLENPLQQLGTSKHTASMFGTYSFEEFDNALKDLELGLGFVYRSSNLAARRETDNSEIFLPGFIRVDASARYQATEKIQLQVNVNNLLDRTYIERSGFGFLGGGFNFADPRSVIGTIRVSL